MKMNNAQKETFREMTEVYNKLPVQKQERAIGIIQGLLMASEESENSPREHPSRN